MIVYTIILIAAGVIVVLLAILAYVAIQDSNRQARGWAAARKGNEEYRADNARLQQENLELKARDADLSEALEATRRLYNNLLREHRELEARNTALVEAMEAKPTQPKRTVRKSSTSGEQQ